MAEARLFSTGNLDFASFVALQKAGFAELIEQHGVQDFLSQEYFKWKYSSPYGPARIAVVIENGQMAAGNSMIPMRIISGKKQVNSWEFCDIATLPQFRGKGFFQTCLKTLKDSLGADEIFWGFPNRNSYSGFVNVGCREKEVITTWVRGLPQIFSSNVGVEQIDSFGPEFDELFSQVRESGLGMVEKSAVYMNWRYVKHPQVKYECFTFRRGGKLEGALVMRKTDVKGGDRALIMELIAYRDCASRTLLNFAYGWARRKGAWPVVAICNTVNLMNAFKAGYIFVPHKLLPKRQVLMGLANGQTAEEIFSQRWWIQTGDWDSF
jgi:predicted acetyltransferase